MVYVECKVIKNDNDLVVKIPANSILPKWLLQRMELWDFENDKGKLSGENGNISSDVLFYPSMTSREFDEGCNGIEKEWGYSSNQKFIVSEKTSYTSWKPANENEDVGEFLGIEKLDS